MNERLAKAEAVFHEALELPPEQREGFLQQACGEDVELRREVTALLRASGVAEHWLKDADCAAGDPSVESPLSESIREGPGMVIGRYKLREKVGEGGCGVVYVADQEEPVRRRVALKIIKLGMDTKAVVGRFEAERQALAMMDHPNIARVFDAGTTDTGRPYFVMELVRGIPITKFCDENKLATRERLELFMKVCQAVQHAHQKGIIHRDLKPSNILVTLHDPDSSGVPKVIDFGIAKATEGRLADATVYTQLHQFIGTPAYMSPEQAEMTGLDIDTRTDIYSLGVLLYELLTGLTPLDGKELLASGLDEMRRTIREKEPVRPSTRLNMLTGADRTTTAHRRATEPVKLEHLLRGDLDWIVMKCLEKDRTRRYETANGLGTDLKRHLSNEPVVARPPSASYRFQKLIRRNKVGFLSASAVVAALVGGLAIALTALSRERAANRVAEQRMVAAMQRVESFLTSDLDKVRQLSGSTLATRGMLFNTLDFMNALAPNATDRPEFLLQSARVHARLAELQGSRWIVSLGDPETALASASNAWTLLRSIPPGALSQAKLLEATYRAEQATGMALEALGREDEALGHYERMLTLATELDVDLPRVGDCRWSSEARNRLAGLYMTKDQYEKMKEHNAYILRDPYLLTNTDSADTKRLQFTAVNLWREATYYRLGTSNYNMALVYLRQSLPFQEACLKQSSANQFAQYAFAITMFNIGIILCRQHHYAEGLPMIQEALRRQEDLVERDRENWVFQDFLLGLLLWEAQAFAEAAKAADTPNTERLRRLEQAQAYYQRCIAGVKAAEANSSGRISWVGRKLEDIERGLQEVETEIAGLQSHPQ